MKTAFIFFAAFSQVLCLHPNFETEPIITVADLGQQVQPDHKSNTEDIYYSYFLLC